MGLIALSRAIEEPTAAARSLAIITLIGFINIPIIKFSVDWWNTLAPARQRFASGQAGDGCGISISTDVDGARLFVFIFYPSFDGHAQ